ncbi:conserved Plasmodium protein, unknown function [Plasmodium gallinaceum]|uniref:RTR1-type domain-containing protein n=1 Tax=Plasmodium gallinaceum TaxID=5849 RepID=A0A1J1GPX4_PLAGA|nr:conserved Plasmodium protein, unknown function [Plasmodium gallinaceum]CRG94342.1 conserved Plasmodium protein, unknown function [Plasmodium gallinaceum]
MSEDREKLNFEREKKISSLSKIYHRKLETLLIYINIPKKKKNKLYFDDFFNIEEICSYINTINNDEEKHEKDYLDDNKNRKSNDNCNENIKINGVIKPCEDSYTSRNININTENEIKTDKNIFIKNLLIFLNNLIILYFSKSDLIDVCINRRSYNKCGFYACDNTFLNNINKSKYKIDAKNKNIYLREYYDLFCSTNCMNFNLHLLKEIINKTKNSTENLDCKKKCQLIHIMFLTFFPFFKFYDIKFLFNNIDKVNIQNNKIYIQNEELQKNKLIMLKIENKTDKEDNRLKSDVLKKSSVGHISFVVRENIDSIEDENNNNIKEIIQDNKNSLKEITQDNKNSLKEIIQEDNITENFENDEIKKYDKSIEEIKEDDKMLLMDKKNKIKIINEKKSKKVSFNEDIKFFKYYKDECIGEYYVDEISINKKNSKKEVEKNEKFSNFNIKELEETSNILSETFFKSKEGIYNFENQSCNKLTEVDDSLYKFKSSSDIENERKNEYFNKKLIEVLDNKNNSYINKNSIDKKDNVINKNINDCITDKIHQIENENTNEDLTENINEENYGEKKIFLNKTENTETNMKKEDSHNDMNEKHEEVKNFVFLKKKYSFDDIMKSSIFDTTKVIGFDYEKQDLINCASVKMNEINLKYSKERNEKKIILLNSTNENKNNDKILSHNSYTYNENCKSIFKSEIDNQNLKDDQNHNKIFLENSKMYEYFNENKKDYDEKIIEYNEQDEFNKKKDNEINEKNYHDVNEKVYDEVEEKGSDKMNGQKSYEMNEKNINEIKEKNMNEIKEKNTNEIKEKNMNEIKEKNMNETNKQNKNETNNQNKDETNEQNEDKVNETDEDFDEINLQDLLLEKKKKIRGEYMKNFKKDIAVNFDSCSDNDNDDEKKKLKINYSKYLYTTNKDNVYEDLSLYVVLWDIFTNNISKYTVHFFTKNEFIIPKSINEVEKERKNEFLYNISQYIPAYINSISSIILNICRTFLFHRPLLPFKKIIYKSIICIIAIAVKRHKLELIPTCELNNIKKAEDYLTSKNKIEQEELNDLSMLFFQNNFY